MNSITISLPLGIDEMNRKVESIASLVRYWVTPSHEKKVGAPRSSDVGRASASDVRSKSIAQYTTLVGTAIPRLARSLRLIF